MPRLPVLLVPSPCDIQRQPTSSVLSASSVRQTPPPAVATHIRHRPLAVHVGDTASAATRPDTFWELCVVGSWMLVSGPSDVQIAPALVPPRKAEPRKAQYFSPV